MIKFLAIYHIEKEWLSSCFYIFCNAIFYKNVISWPFFSIQKCDLNKNNIKKKDWQVPSGLENRVDKMPSIISGVRQIGKTTSIREFGKTYKSFIEIIKILISLSRNSEFKWKVSKNRLFSTFINFWKYDF